LFLKISNININELGREAIAGIMDSESILLRSSIVGPYQGPRFGIVLLKSDFRFERLEKRREVNSNAIFPSISYVADENGNRAGFRLGAAAIGKVGPTKPINLEPGSNMYLPPKTNVDRSYLPPQ